MEKNGFAVIPNLLSSAATDKTALLCEVINVPGAGSRNLMALDWVQELSEYILHHSAMEQLLPRNAVAVQCTYFRKTPQTNWLVALHRDISIPVRQKFEAEGWGGWNLKEGVWFTQPPTEILGQLVAARVHLEDNTAANGALQVVPGSHLNPEIRVPRQVCEVPSGGALAMSPLLFHASSKLSAGERRVLHFLYGPEKLPVPAEWPHVM